jgi:hypothetical protein
MVADSAFLVRLSIVAALVFGVAESGFGQGVPPADSPQSLSRDEAAELAERFVRENGYTNAPQSEVRSRLNYESIERADNRAELLKSRWNTLSPKAIGIKATADGWGVAFDYVADHPGICRVVTMKVNGADIRMQHEDGLRGFWLGFGDP